MDSVKIVLLTGGSSGIGAATASILSEAGMKVYAGSRRGIAGKPAPGIIPLQLDVNDTSSVERAVARIIEEEGRLDAVICNAGNGIYGPVEGTTEEEARYQFETCYFGALRTIQACLPSSGHSDSDGSSPSRLSWPSSNSPSKDSIPLSKQHCFPFPSPFPWNSRERGSNVAAYFPEMSPLDSRLPGNSLERHKKRILPTSGAWRRI